MAELNKDQIASLRFIKNWWGSNSLYCVLDGAGGTGKTFLVNTILNELPGAVPLLLSPTHEALKQLKDKIQGDYCFKTVHSALGISPTTDRKDLEFEHKALPSLWDDFNLCILDEASMIDDWLIELLRCTGIKILFIGHKSQLPPIVINRPIFDKCISPVFTRGFPTTTLTIPQRNTGSLWDFNNYLERMIYSQEKVIPNTYDIKRADLEEYIHSEGKQLLAEGNTKIVLWSNEGVNKYNQKVRSTLFGSDSMKFKFISGDKIILTQPLTVISSLERYSDAGLKELNYKDTELDRCYSNTKAEVLICDSVTVELNPSLVIDCYRLFVRTDEGFKYFYNVKDKHDTERIATYYEHQAWSKYDKKDKIKAYQQRRFIMSCFAHILHYYAATSHRLQGATIDNVIVINSDISKNMCRIEQYKCRYVACSRAKNNLMFFRG